MSNQEKLEEVSNLALDSLARFFKKDKNEEQTDKQIAVARIASTAVSAWTRSRQTEGSNQALSFMIIRELAQNPEQLAEYIRISMPNSVIVKALPQESIKK